MKFKDIQDLICDDLIIIDHTNNETYYDVYKYSERAEKFKDREVIGVRSQIHKNNSYVLISIR